MRQTKLEYENLAREKKAEHARMYPGKPFADSYALAAAPDSLSRTNHS
jgi:hypothetical protein